MGLGGPCVELVFSRMESQTAPQDQEVEDPGQPPRVCLGKGKALEGDQEKQSRRKAIKMKVLTGSSVCVGGCTAKEEAPSETALCPSPHSKERRSMAGPLRAGGRSTSLLASAKRGYIVTGCLSAHHTPLTTLRCSLLLPNWLG